MKFKQFPASVGVNSNVQTRSSTQAILPTTATALPSKIAVHSSSTQLNSENMSTHSIILKPSTTMSARGPQENSYATITSDFQGNVAAKMISQESKNLIVNARTTGYAVNGAKGP